MTLALSSSSVTGWQRLARITALLAPLVAPAASPRPSSQPVPITLEECIRTALTQNREIQIERVQPRLVHVSHHIVQSTTGRICFTLLLADGFLFLFLKALLFFFALAEGCG